MDYNGIYMNGTISLLAIRRFRSCGEYHDDHLHNEITIQTRKILINHTFINGK